MNHREISREIIEIALMNMSRQPFRDLLAMILGCPPDEESLRAYAKRCPDRWGQLAAIFARLTGFTEKIQVETNFATTVQQMSDMELMQKLADLEKQLKEIGITEDNTNR